MNTSLIKFGTDGWRAFIAKEFTFKNLELVVLAICRFLKSNNLDKGVFIGYDNRFLSEDFARHCAITIQKEGLKSFIASASVPTPLTAFMSVDLDLDGSIMITASHNPSKYNGIKFISGYGGPAQDETTKEIESFLVEITEDEKKYKDKESVLYETKDIIEISDFNNYKKKLIGLIDESLIRHTNPNIAVNTMNGSGSVIFPEILNEMLHLDIKLYNNHRDVLFGGQLPDPSEKNLTVFKNAVLSENIELGVALDGDADRFGAIDGSGYYINPNNAISLILNYFIETGRYSKDDTAVRTVATTHLIDKICIQNGLKSFETPVGFKYIAKEMLKGNVLIGGEESGGLSVKGHIPEKDGLLACLILIEIQAYLKKYKNGMLLSEYLKNIFDKYGYFYNTRLDIDIKQEKKKKILDYFLSLDKKLIDGKKVKGVYGLDGVKVLIEDGSWILVRASGTEPLMRCYLESEDSKYFLRLQEYVKNIILKLN